MARSKHYSYTTLGGKLRKTADDAIKAHRHACDRPAETLGSPVAVWLERERTVLCIEYIMQDGGRHYYCYRRKADGFEWY